MRGGWEKADFKKHQLWPRKELVLGEVPFWNQETGFLAVENQEPGAKLSLFGTHLAMETAK